VTLPWYITISIFPVTIADPLHTKKPVPLEVRCKAFKLHEILRESITTENYLVLSYFKKNGRNYIFYMICIYKTKVGTIILIYVNNLLIVVITGEDPKLGSKRFE